MQKSTKFGKIIRDLMNKYDISQGKLAKELGVSPSILSNYITGKNIPEMEFLLKCVKKFNLKNDEIINLFYIAFSTIAKQNGKIIYNTSLINSNRIEMISKALTVFLLYPEVHPHDDLDKKMIHELTSEINKFFDGLKKFTDPLLIAE